MRATPHRRVEPPDANHAATAIRERAASRGAGIYVLLLLATLVLTPEMNW